MSDRFKSDGLLSFDELMDLINKTINTAWGESWGDFQAVFPKVTDEDNIEFPIITYDYPEKSPYSEKKPRVRERFADPDHPDENVTIWGQMYKYKIHFRVWSDEPQKLNDLVDRFEQFMHTYTGFFMKAGIGQTIYVGTFSNEPILTTRDPMYSKTVVYESILERQWVARSYVLNEIQTKVQLGLNNNNEEE